MNIINKIFKLKQGLLIDTFTLSSIEYEVKNLNDTCIELLKSEYSNSVISKCNDISLNINIIENKVNAINTNLDNILKYLNKCTGQNYKDIKELETQCTEFLNDWKVFNSEFDFLRNNFKLVKEKFNISEDKPSATIKNRILDELKKQNRDQNWLTEQTGLSKGAISLLVSNKNQTTIENALKIAKALNVTMDDLFYNEQEANELIEIAKYGTEIETFTANKAAKIIVQDYINKNGINPIYNMIPAQAEVNSNLKQSYIKSHEIKDFKIEILMRAHIIRQDELYRFLLDMGKLEDIKITDITLENQKNEKIESLKIKFSNGEIDIDQFLQLIKEIEI